MNSPQLSQLLSCLSQFLARLSGGRVQAAALSNYSGKALPVKKS
jgi:hypothetical protein